MAPQTSMQNRSKQNRSKSTSTKKNVPAEAGAGAVATNDTTSLEQHKNKMKIMRDRTYRY